MELRVSKPKVVGRCVKLKYYILGKHVRGSYLIVTGFIPDMPFVHLGIIYFSMIFITHRS